jgi:hypothetical protein
MSNEDGWKITEVLSYASGWDLLQQKPHLITDVAEGLRRIRLSGSGTLFRLMKTRLLSPITSWERFFRTRGWEEHHIHRKPSGRTLVSIPNVKDRVALRSILGERRPSTAFANWLMVEVPISANARVCDLCLLCVFASEESDHQHLFTMRDCQTQLEEFASIPGSVPFVVLGVSRGTVPLRVVEISSDPRIGPGISDGITKSIEFPQQYYQAGVSILSYFGEVLKQRHPEVRAKVRIEQDGLIVRLHIESASGDKEIIERTLEEYGLVIAQQMPPAAFLSNDLQVLALEQKLELAKTEIRYTQQLLALAEGAYQQRVNQLEDEITHLRTYIGRHLGQIDSVHALLVRHAESNERLLLAHASQAESLIQHLIRQSADNQTVLEALTVIDQKLTEGIKASDEETIKRALAIIRREKPTIFTQLQSVFLNLSYEVSGGFLFKWIDALTRQL